MFKNLVFYLQRASAKGVIPSRSFTPRYIISGLRGALFSLFPKLRVPCQIWWGTKVLVPKHRGLGAWALIILVVVQSKEWISEIPSLMFFPVYLYILYEAWFYYGFTGIKGCRVSRKPFKKWREHHIYSARHQNFGAPKCSWLLTVFLFSTENGEDH